MKLIISGSYMDIMKSLIEYEAPLYGRFSNVLKLKPMNYLEASEFYPSFSKEDKVLLYSVFGGIPYYNSLIQTDRSAIQNIFDLVLNENAPLKEEVPSFLKSEISKAENANSVFDAIAGGKTKFKDILDESGLGSDAALNNLLLKLIGMEIIEKEYPLNHPQDKKKANYRITDSLALFYYRYLFRNLSKIETMGAKAFFTRYIKEDFESLYIPKSFEKICRQFLIEENRSGRIQPVLEEIGKYYYDDPKNHRNGEFDIVARDENGWIFYEAKYKKRPVDDTQILEEAEQVKNSPLPAYQFGFFSRSGFVLHNKYPYLFFTLDDLFPENR